MRASTGAEVRAGCDRPHPFHLTWHRGLFLHWPMDPERLRPHVPDPLILDVREGRAYLGVLPFVATDVRPRGVPGWLGREFPELNVRTYVRWNDRPGVFFFSIDVGNRPLAALGRRLSDLPVRHAEMRARRDGDGARFTHEGTRNGRPVLDVRYEPTGPPAHAEPDSLAAWVFERYRLYHPTPDGVIVASVRHEPWPVQPGAASMRRNDVFEAQGLPESDDEPVVHYAHDHEMDASLPRRRNTFPPRCRPEP